MRIALISSEAVPFSKTGGLADVAGTLYREFCDMGHDVSLFVPLYRHTRLNFADSLRDIGISIDVPLGTGTEPCRIFTIDEKQPSRQKSCRVYFVSNKDFFDRDELYGTAAGDYPDNAARFAFFSRSVLETCKKLSLKPDVLHCNDWQTALVPLYLETLYWHDPAFEKTRTMLTIHNLGYQGLFPPEQLGLTGLGKELFTPAGIEFFGKINFLKAGLISADIITTVSDKYSHEILTPEFGFGLHGVLETRKDALFGVLNGIDCNEWDPASDRLLPSNYSDGALSGKKKCKKELMGRFSFKGTTETPMLCFIGRISEQKGITLLVDVMEELLKLKVNLFILGRGDAVLEKKIQDIAVIYPKNICFVSGFDEKLAHLAYAGSDIFLMPSVYEPCGLGQMIAMRYGSVPVAYNTGGLADSISVAGDRLALLLSGKPPSDMDVTGFLFNKHTSAAFLSEIQNALKIFAKKAAWEKIMQCAMNRDFSWAHSAEKYIKLYKGRGKP